MEDCKSTHIVPDQLAHFSTFFIAILFFQGKSFSKSRPNKSMHSRMMVSKEKRSAYAILDEVG